MFVDFGKTLGNLSEKIPGGILIFFPSYKLMEQCYEIWQSYNIIHEIEKSKIVLREPKEASNF